MGLRGNRGVEKTTSRTALRSVLLIKHYSDNQIKKNEMGGHIVRMGNRKGAYRILVGKPEGKRPRGRPRCK